ncbi:RNase III [Singapore grouper iridovirus]|uniref:RNase III n=1 Tax=Singapore grouper iridovirus TaxID=262968 RepID=Q5YFI1_9VIRU|nr:RNase III [Singapore grouper iridovirus]AAS18099.1 RNase III [Singapore grouper iridovirus]WAU86793.1 RNase III [Singapore grouper iridovirus]
MDQWLRTVLSESIKEKYMPFVLRRRDLWAKVFTPKSVDPVNNYEALEIVGDGLAGCFFPIYFINRFPQLNSAEGVKLVARLKINYASRKSFAAIAGSLGFWQHVKKPTDTVITPTSKEILLEDVFEAFLGAISIAVDHHFGIPALGVAVVYDFLKAVFDKIDISLNYVDLFDAKTRLKELIDVKKSELGDLRYVHGNNITQIFLGERLVGSATGPIKKDREKDAAARALTLLRSEGHTRDGATIFEDPVVIPEAAARQLTQMSSTFGGATILKPTNGISVVEGSGSNTSQALKRIQQPPDAPRSRPRPEARNFKDMLMAYMNKKGTPGVVDYKYSNGKMTLYLSGKPVAVAEGTDVDQLEQLVAKKTYTYLMETR